MVDSSSLGSWGRFALHIGHEIREKASQVAGVKRVEVTVQDRLQTDEINAELQANLA